MQALEVAATTHGSKPALRAKTASGGWSDTTWAEYRDQVRRAAKGLIALGLEPGKGVVLIGFNCEQWLIGGRPALRWPGFVTIVAK